MLSIYNFFKTSHPESLLLFRLTGTYLALFNDADILCNLYPKCDSTQLCSGKIFVPESSINDVETVLKNAGIKYCIIEYRGENGEFSLPKVNQIYNEIDDDY